jgi:hypothetical protein
MSTANYAQYCFIATHHHNTTATLGSVFLKDWNPGWTANYSKAGISKHMACQFNLCDPLNDLILIIKCNLAQRQGSF